jgi:hypothetical protein
MKNSSNPQKILLMLHVTTHERMSVAELPYGMSKTRWINDAICEKLDREQPQTIFRNGKLPEADAERVKTPRENLVELEAQAKRQQPKRDTGEHVWHYKWDEDGELSTLYMAAQAKEKWRLKHGEPQIGLDAEMERIVKGTSQELSDEQKREIREEHAAKAQAR